HRLGPESPGRLRRGLRRRRRRLDQVARQLGQSRPLGCTGRRRRHSLARLHRRVSGIRDRRVGAMGKRSSLAPRSRRVRLLLAASLVLALEGPAFADPAPEAPASASAKSATVDGPTDAELERMLAPLYGDDLDARQKAASSVASLNADALPAIAKKLAEDRKASAAAVGAAIKAARDGAKDGKNEID